MDGCPCKTSILTSSAIRMHASYYGKCPCQLCVQPVVESNTDATATMTTTAGERGKEPGREQLSIAKLKVE